MNNVQTMIHLLPGAFGNFWDYSANIITVHHEYCQYHEQAWRTVRLLQRPTKEVQGCETVVTTTTNPTFGEHAIREFSLSDGMDEQLQSSPAYPDTRRR